MAISLVGTPQANGVTNGGNTTLTFDGSPQEGDMVFLAGTIPDDNGADLPGPVTSGYTELFRFTSPTDEIATGIWIKFFGSTPDASVVCLGSGEAQEGNAYTSYVLRGVDPSTPLDASIVETGVFATSNPDLDAITTVTDGAWVIPVVASRWVSTASAYPSGYSNGVSFGTTDTRHCATSMASKEVAVAGVENPGAFTQNQNDRGWYGFTVALRPAGAAGGSTVFFDLTDLPSDFGNAETAEIVVRTRGVDIGATPLKLFAQIFRSDETTPLSDEVEVAEEATDSSFANSSPVVFTGLNTTAGKSVWDGARIRFRWGT